VSLEESRAVATLLIVVVPALVIWLVVLVDVLRQPARSGRWKALWVLACTLVWPVQIVYLLVRPQQGRVERLEHRADPHARLVEATLAHEAGRIDDAAMAEVARQLRGR
jgi:uncharacterized membrane protein (UPF0182 family)